MRILYSFLLYYFSLVKLSFSWECDERCPEYLKCVAEEEAKQSNNTRRLFLPQTNLFDAPYFDVYEQQGPKTLDMSVFTTSNMNGLRGGPMQRRHHGRILQEVYFQLKLYHELGYCWQSEWEDRVWCAECTNDCEEWEELWFQKCNKTEPKQYFIYEAMPNGVGGRIKPLTNQSLCWERTRVNAHQLKPCDDISGTVNVSQIFRGFDFYDKFELHPFNRGVNTTHPSGPMCLSCHHHPKRYEIIHAEACENVRAAPRYMNTSFWTVYNVYMDSAYKEGISKAIDSNTGNATFKTQQEHVPEPVTTTEAPIEKENQLWSALASLLDKNVDTESP